MIGKQGLSLLLALLLSFAASSQAREIWTQGVPEPYFKHFLDFYKADPSAMGRWATGLKNISSDQLDRTLKALDTTQFTYLYPMEMKGYDLPAENGIPTDQLSLMAVRAGKLVPIPFQFDEFDKTGLIWIDGFNDHDPEGKPGIFDDFDELVFMFRDGGQERYDPSRHTLKQGLIVEEIRLDSPRNQPRYIYLVRNNPARSRADYVQANLEEGWVQSTLMHMDYNPKDFTEIDKMYPRLGPHKDQSVFDNLYVNISTGILNQNLRVDLDTRKNIKATPVAVHDGPVRASMLVKARIWYAFMPTFFSQKFQVDFYEQSVTIPSRFAIGSMRVLKFFLMFLRDPRIHFALDLHNMDGARVTFQTVYGQKRYGVVDGKMSPFEQTMTRTRLPGDWVYMDSNQGWEMFFSNHMPVVPGGLFDSFLSGLRMNMFYQDDPKATTDYERFAGASPRLGFESEGLPRTAISLMGAIPRLDYADMDSLGEAIVALAAADKDGKFRKYDAIVNEHLTEMMKAGQITTVDQLADAFIADLDRMNFTGIPRATFNQLIHQAIVDTTPAVNQVHHGKVLARMVELAKQQGIDITRLRYATMDNTLWFPAWVGPGGPEDFQWQVTHPPVARVMARPAPPAARAATR
ncbi:hypothetical protein A11A3_02067 [Alcanivorax hongdengensis A-11-3]|uniref:Uncharacterized protein n=1 Tax=Alcanivorax hongdengensis A-11-3 TaxID=1177179 RepID=L0WF05_9GAMM|nr:hypothetical protein [Alcanivorax hongdengensis]EKF75616.1 hypothetical protein A11A3_02067 [Alcanivorax hongdengensis A-11-3]